MSMTVEEVLFQVGQHQIPPLVAKGYLPVVQRCGIHNEHPPAPHHVLGIAWVTPSST